MSDAHEPDRLEPPPPEEGRAALSAYFDLLRRKGVPLVVETADGVEVDGRIESLDDTKGRLVLSFARPPAHGLDADDPVDLLFTLQGQRWAGQTRVHFHNDRCTRYTLLLPERLESRDRRREARLPLDPALGAQAELELEDLEGRILRGRLSNVSEGGFRVQVLGVWDRAEGREIEPRELPLAEGALLSRVRLVGLLDRDLEARGRIMEVAPSALGPVLGVRFVRLAAEDRQGLLDWLARGLPPPGTAPVPLLEAVTAEIEAAVETLGGWENAGAESPEAGPAKAPPPPPPSHAPDRQEALLRLKKRLRHLVVAMPDGPEREVLLGYLWAEGYAQVSAVDDLRALARLLREGPVHLLLIDGGVPELPPLELASFMRAAGDGQPCAILLASDGDLSGLAGPAAEAGVDRILPRPYLTEDLAPLLEVSLGLRDEEEEGKAASMPGAAGSSLNPRHKRFRSVALVMPAGGEREGLQRFLAAQGFTRVLPAGSVGELARAGNPDLLFVDWPDPALPELELLGFLRRHPFAGTPPVVLASAQVTPRLAEGARALGVARLLVKPYALDQGLEDLLLEVLWEAGGETAQAAPAP